MFGHSSLAPVQPPFSLIPGYTRNAETVLVMKEKVMSLSGVSRRNPDVKLTETCSLSGRLLGQGLERPDAPQGRRPQHVDARPQGWVHKPDLRAD